MTDGNAVTLRPFEEIGSIPTTLQRAFDAFIDHDIDGDRLINEAELASALNSSFRTLQIHSDDVSKIMTGASQSGKMTFSQFYTVFACLTLIDEHFHVSDISKLQPDHVRRALLEVGLTPTKGQIEAMFELGDLYKSHELVGRISVNELLKVYFDHANKLSRENKELFLHSWYAAGRNSTPYNQPIADISPVEDFVAGTFAGVALTLVGHPFDTVKVRMQTKTIFRSGLDCVLQTIRNEGFFALYKGMSGPMATIPLVNAVVFAAYAQGKDFLHSLQPELKPLNMTEITLAGAYAGLVNCVVVTPVELVKTRLQIQYEPQVFHNTFHGPMDCARKIVAQNGIKGLFRGMSATIYREVPGYGGQFFMYEALKRAWTPEGQKVQDLGFFPLVMAGGTAGIFGWLVSYPMDYIKSQIQAEPYDRKTPYPKNRWLLDGGFFSCWKQTVREQGHKALWRGFGPCVARAFPANAAGFGAYELALKIIRGVDMPNA